MSPEMTGAIFALVGAIVGALAVTVGTYATLRQQQRTWKSEKHLEELRIRRDELNELVDGLGNLDLLGEQDLKFFISKEPSSRATLYKLLVLAEINIMSMTSINSMKDIIAILQAITRKRDEIEKEIKQLLTE